MGLVLDAQIGMLRTGEYPSRFGSKRKDICGGRGRGRGLMEIGRKRGEGERGTKRVW